MIAFAYQYLILYEVCNEVLQNVSDSIDHDFPSGKGIKLRRHYLCLLRPLVLQM